MLVNTVQAIIVEWWQMIERCAVFTSYRWFTLTLTLTLNLMNTLQLKSWMY